MWSSQEQSLYYFDITPIWNNDLSVAACRQLATLQMMHIEQQDMLDKKDFIAYLIESDLLNDLQKWDRSFAIPPFVFDKIEEVTQSFFEDPNAFTAHRYKASYRLKAPQIGQVIKPLMSVGGAIKETLFSFFSEDVSSHAPPTPTQSKEKTAQSKAKDSLAPEQAWMEEALFYVNPMMGLTHYARYREILDKLCEQFLTRNKANLTSDNSLAHTNPKVFHFILQKRLESFLVQNSRSDVEIPPKKNNIEMRDVLVIIAPNYDHILTYLQLLELNGYRDMNTALLEAIHHALEKKSEDCKQCFKKAGIDLEAVIALTALKLKEYDLNQPIASCLPKKTSLIRRVISFIRIGALRASLVMTPYQVKDYLLALPNYLSRIARMAYGGSCMALFYINHMIVGIKPKNKILETDRIRMAPVVRESRGYPGVGRPDSSHPLQADSDFNVAPSRRPFFDV